MPQITVTINGKNYRMACDEGQESHLEELASSFDERISALRGSFGEIGDQRLTVMAAIMVMDELGEMKKKLRGLEFDLDILRNSRDEVLGTLETSDEELVDEILSAAEKIENVSARLSGNETSRQ